MSCCLPWHRLQSSCGCPLLPGMSKAGHWLGAPGTGEVSLPWQGGLEGLWGPFNPNLPGFPWLSDALMFLCGFLCMTFLAPFPVYPPGTNCEASGQVELFIRSQENFVIFVIIYYSRTSSSYKNIKIILNCCNFPGINKSPLKWSLWCIFVFIWGRQIILLVWDVRNCHFRHSLHSNKTFCLCSVLQVSCFLCVMIMWS